MSQLQIHHVVSGTDATVVEAFNALQGDPAFPGDAVAPGTEGLLAVRDAVPVARISLHLVSNLVGAPGLSGLLGHYEAVDETIGVQILGEATSLLRARGAERALGPMNGNTWSRYRFAVPDPSGQAPTGAVDWFFGEPLNPPAYPLHWRAAGMSVVSSYESRIEFLGDVEEEPNAGTVRIRPINVAEFSAELEALHAVSLDAFDANYLYSPLTLEAFARMYAPFRTRLDPAFVLLAEREGGEVIGYIFSYADPLSLVDGRPTRLIIKTLAVAKAGRGQRVSSLLLDRVRRLARQRGFTEVISALMRSDNVTRGMSERRSSRVLRRYELYGMIW